MASADLTVLRYVKESSMGVAPANPDLKQIRYTGESLNYTINNTKSAEITPTRTETDLVQVEASAAGDIKFELSYQAFDDFMAAAFCNSWVAGAGNSTLVNGIDLATFHIQKHFQDMSVPQYHDFAGCAIEGMSLKMDMGKILEGTFSVMAFGVVAGSAQIAGATESAPAAFTPMNAVTNVQNFVIDGVPFTGCISSLGLALKNGIRAIRCVGSLPAKDMKLGTLEVTGDMVFYFNDGSNYELFTTGAEFGFTFDLIDIDGNKYAFSVPRAKFESGEVVAGSRNSDVMFNAKWRALYDAVAGHVISVTSTPAP